MGYKVIKMFTDGQDNGHVYNEGDSYPRKGYTPSPERIAGLLSENNKRGVPMITFIPEEKGEKPKAEKPKAKTTKAKDETAKKPTRKKARKK